MTITASEARKRLFSLLEEISTFHTRIEITSKHGRVCIIDAETLETLEQQAAVAGYQQWANTMNDEDHAYRRARRGWDRGE